MIVSVLSFMICKNVRRSLFTDQSVQCGDLISCIKLHIQCNLVVTASSGMQLLSCIPDPVDQICLYKTVDIFVFLCNLKLSALYIPADAFQSVQNLSASPRLSGSPALQAS